MKTSTRSLKTKILTFLVFIIAFTLISNNTFSQTLVPASGSNTWTTCSGTLYDHAYTANYSNSVNGYTTIYPSVSGNGVRLTGSIVTESGYDFVKIYNGVGTGGTLLWSGSGSVSIGTVSSTSGPLTVQFYSDGSVVNSGFALTVSCFALCTTPVGGYTYSTASGVRTGNYTCITDGTFGTTTVAGYSGGTIGGWEYSFNGEGGPYTDWGMAGSNPSTGGCCSTTEIWIRARIVNGACTAWSSATQYIYRPVVTPGAFSTSWSGDHYVCASSFTTTVPNTSAANTLYRLCRSADNNSGCNTWVNSATQYSPGATVTVSGGDMPVDGAYRYYMWYAYDNCGNQSAAGTQDYVRKNPALSTPATFSTSWSGDHYVCGSFTATVPTVTSGSYYRLGMSTDNGSGLNAWVNGGATYAAGATVTVQGADLPTAGYYRYYMWYAWDICGNAIAGAQNYVRMTAIAVTCPSNIVVNNACGATAVSYSIPTSNCGTPTLTAGLASGSSFPIGTTTVTYSAGGAPNGAGGTFIAAPGSSAQTIALKACESVYGAGQCTTGSCGSFTYYYYVGHVQCDCNKAPGSYEFIYSNSGYTQVGQDYGGAATDVSSATPFTRKKIDAGCTGNSWNLTQANLTTSVGASCSFTVTVNHAPTSSAPPTFSPTSWTGDHYVCGSFTATVPALPAGASYYRLGMSTDNGSGLNAWVNGGTTYGAGAIVTVSGADLPSANTYRYYMWYVWDVCGTAYAGTQNYVRMSGAPAAPAAFSTSWSGDHYICAASSFATTAPSGADHYRLCRSVDNAGGCSTWVNGGTTYGQGASVTVSGSDLPSSGAYRYYMWYAYDFCGNQSAAGTQDYVRMNPALSTPATFSTSWYGDHYVCATTFNATVPTVTSGSYYRLCRSTDNAGGCNTWVNGGTTYGAGAVVTVSGTDMPSDNTFRYYTWYAWDVCGNAVAGTSDYVRKNPSLGSVPTPLPNSGISGDHYVCGAFSTTVPTVTGAAYYRLGRSTDNGSGLYDWVNGATTYTAGQVVTVSSAYDLPSNGTYRYYMWYAWDLCGNANAGPQDYIRMSTSPSTPTLTAAGSGYTDAYLTFASVGNDVITYYYEVYTTGGVAVATGNTTNTYVTVGGLSCNTQYYARAYAKSSCNNGPSGWSGNLYFYTNACYAGCTNCTAYYGGYFTNGTSGWAQTYAGAQGGYYGYYSLDYQRIYQWNTFSSNFDTQLTLYPAGTCASGYNIAANDDYGGVQSLLAYKPGVQSVSLLLSAYNCTTSVTNSGYINWRSIPNQPNATATAITICSGQAVTFTETAGVAANNDSYVNIQWATDAAFTQLVSADANAITVYPTSTTTYYVRYQILGGNTTIYSEYMAGTITVDQTAPGAPGQFSTAWCGDHYIGNASSFNTTVPTVSGATYYKLCRSENNASGCSAWVNGGASYTAGATVTVSGGDLPADDNYKWYYWYAWDGCNNQSTNGTPDYVRMGGPAGYDQANPINVGTISCSQYSSTVNTASCYTNNYAGATNHPGNDVWYQFTVPTAGYVDISNCGAGWDTYLHIWNGSTEITFNDDNGPLCSANTASLRYYLTAGTYWAITDGYSGNGTVTTTINFTPADAGTLVNSASTVCSGSNVTYTATNGSYATFSRFEYQWNGTGAWATLGTTNPYTWTATTPGSTLYVRAVFNNGGCSETVSSNTVTTFIDNTGPTLDNCYTNSNCWVTDGAHDYTITVVSTDPNGIGGSPSQWGQMALVNYQGSNAGHYGGYFSWSPWHYSQSNNQMAATGGGFASQDGGYGYAGITLVGCTTSLSGNTRTTTFTVRPNSAFPAAGAINDISTYSMDNCGNITGWQNWDINFSSGDNSGTISGAVSTACAGSTVSYSWAGGEGAFQYFEYQWGGTGGAWSGSWIASNPGYWTASGQGSTLYVRAVSSIGNCTLYSAPVSTYITISPTGGTVTGPTTPCPFTAATYSVSGASNVSGYTWSLPPGWNITYGQGTPSINVSTSNTTGNVTCQLSNNGCNGSAPYLAISTDPTAPVYVGTTVTPSTGGFYNNGVNYYVKSGSQFFVNIHHTDNCASSTQYLEFTQQPNSAFGDWSLPNIKSYGSLYSIAQNGYSTTFTDGPADNTQLDIQNAMCASTGNCNTDVNGKWTVVAGAGVSTKYHVTVYMYDAMGQGVGYTDSGLDLYLDNTNPNAPSAPYITSGTGTNVQTWATAGATDGESGVNGAAYEWQYSYDNSGWVAWFTGGLSNTGTWPCDKNIYVRVRATDNVGNVGAWSTSGGPIATNSSPSAPTSVTVSAATICTGGSADLTLVGGSLGNGTASWKWYSGSCGGTAVGTGTTVTVNPTVTTTYYVRAEGTTCPVNTGCASTTITVVPDPAAPTATKSPVASIVCVGQALTLTGVTDNGGGIGSCNIEYSHNGGAWTTTLSPITASLGTNTIAIRKNCNGSGCDLSGVNTYSWTVVADPAISISGATSICYNGSATLTSSVSGGTGTMTYQWQQLIGSTWTNVGGNTSTYTASNLTSTADFRCVYSSTGDGCGTATSNTQTITVWGNLTANLFGGSGNPTPICYNTTPTTFSVTATGGNGSYSYLWYKNNISTGVTTQTYSTGNLTANTTVYCAVTSATCVVVNTGIYTVLVYPTLNIPTLSGGGTNLCYNTAPPVFTANGTGGDGTYTYQWYLNGSPTATTQTYTPPALTNPTNTLYCAVSSCGQTFNSANYNIAVYPIVTATLSGGSGDPTPICYNTTPATFVATGGGGTGTYTYLWYKNNISTGVTTQTYSTGNLTANTTVYCAVTGCSNGPVNTSTYNVAVYPAIGTPTITGGNDNVCYNAAPAVFTANATGGNSSYTYLWYLNGISTGITTNTYQAPALTANAYVSVAVSSCGQTANSANFYINVYGELSAALSGGSTNICYNGTPTTFSVTGSGGNGTDTYLWYKGGISTGVTTQTYSTGPLTANTYVYCVVTDLCGSVQSDTYNIDVYGDLSASINGTDADICYNSNPGILTATGTNGTGLYTYLWYKNGSPTAITTQTYDPGNLTGSHGTTFMYYCAVTSAPCGTVNTPTRTYTIESVAPSITCPATANVGTNSACYYNGTIGTATSTDNCAGVIAITNNAPASFPIGTTIVQWTATDLAGNYTKCEQTVVVTDDDAPAITCPANIQINVTPGLCSGIPTYTAPIGTDNCSGATTALIGGLASGVAYPVGLTVNTYKVTDAVGLTNTCSFNVVVLDNIPPTISCVNNQVRSTNTGVCTYTTVGTEFNPTAVNDNCSAFTYVNDKNNTSSLAGYVFSLGTTTVTWTATDASNNVTTCTNTITVNDNEFPVITCPGNFTLYTDGACSVVLGYTIHASDNCSFTMEQIAGLASGSAFPVGTTLNTFKVTDGSGNVSTCSFSVEVIDDDIPSMSCTGTLSRNVNTGTCTYTAVTNEFDPTSIHDNCSGATTSYVLTGATTGNGGSSLAGVIFNKGVTTITWTITDQSGNHSNCVSHLTVIDNIPPTISCIANQERNTTTSVCYYKVIGTEFNPTFNDNCPGAFIGYTLSGATTGTGTSLATVNLNVGLTTIVWKVTDAVGAVASCSFTVLVKDIVAPTLTCKGALPRNTNSGLCTYKTLTTEFNPNTTSDNCAYTLTYTLSGATTGTGSNTLVNVLFNKGVTVVTWTATDVNGNVTSCNSTVVTVTDAERPTYTRPVNTSIYTDANCNYNAGVAFTGDVTNEHDNCATGIEATYIDVISTTGLCEGSKKITRTWALADSNGNVALTIPLTNTQQIIMVYDNIIPTFTRPADKTIYTNSSCGYDASLAVTGDVTDEHDNCSTGINATYSDVITNGACVGSKIITRTWSLVDKCGNAAANQIQTITILDKTPPTITAASNQTVECDGSGNTAQLNAWLANHGGATATDACSAVVWTNNFTALSDLCGATGAATVTFTATDNCGNASSVSATFTIVDVTAPTITAASNQTVECDGAGNTAQLNAWLANHGGATASDICSGVVWSNNFTALSDLCGATGAATVTFTATDDCGNASSVSATFTIQDVTAPTITAASNQTVECDGAGNLTQLNTWLANHGGATASDICSGVEWSNNFTALSDGCGATGSALVTFTATDACGNASSVSATFTIQDVTAPTITAASNQIVECNGMGNLTELNAWLANHGGATASDICSGVEWSNNFIALSDDCGATGTALVTFTATDDCGNASSVSARFTIVDLTAPVITCPANVTINCQDNTSSLFNGVATASDICSSVSITESDVSTQDMNPLHTGYYNYTIARTWKAEDLCGNTTTCVQTITVQDVTNPTITCPANVTINCQDNTTSSAQGVATGGDICSNVYITESDVSTQDMNPLHAGYYNYTITRTWKSTDVTGNFVTCNQIITVQDVTNPTITCPANVTINCQDNTTSASNGVATGTDICSNVYITESDVSTQDMNPLNTGYYNYTITRTWKSTDVTGNFVTCNQIITVQDVTNPTITCPANVTINCQDNTTSASNGVATGGDICSSAVYITESDVSTQDMNPLNCGYYNYTITRTWKSTDVTGNFVTCDQIITVQDVTKPTFTRPADITLYLSATTMSGCSVNDLPNGLAGDVTDEWDNCATDLQAVYSDEVIHNCGSTYTILRTWKLKDHCNNEADHQVQTITVVDTVAPVITCPASLTINCQDDNTPVGTGTATATDNCTPIADIAITFTDVSTQDMNSLHAGYYNYTITRTWKAVDLCNNTTTCVQVITVQDVTNPTITCPADVTINCQDNTASSTQGVATGTDICSNVYITESDVSTQDMNPLHAGYYNYTITRTWKSTDVTGNNVSCVQIITVQDVTNPTITCPANVTLNCQDNTTSASNGVATGTDICSNVYITESDVSTQDMNPLHAGYYNYTITRTWKSTDVTGNNVSCVQIITVHDVTNPTITCPANVTLNCQDNTTSASNGVATGTDICSNVYITESDVSTQDMNPLHAGYYNYTITRTWKSTDVTGNFVTCNQIITVHDVTNPTITCPANVTLNCQDNTTSASNGVATGTDICSNVYITESDVSTQDMNPLHAGYYNYTITRTWKSTDVTGNFVTCNQIITVHDVTAPVINPQASDLQPPYLMSNVNAWLAAHGNAGATDNCGPITWTNNYEDFDICSTEGFPVTFTATDVSGNSSTTTAYIVRPSLLTVTCPVPVVTAYNTCSFGGQNANILIGLTSSSIVLPGAVTGGTPGYTYSWYPSTGLSNTHVIAPTFTAPTMAAGSCYTYNFQLTVTDANGCVSMIPVEVRVLNAQTSTNSNKYTVCHNPNNPHSINVAVAAINNHFATYPGDCLGSCEMYYGTTGGTCGENVIAKAVETEVLTTDGIILKNYPNPFEDNTTISFILPEDNHVSLEVYDLSGKLLQTLYNAQASKDQEYKTEFDGSSLPSGIYIYRMTTNDAVFTGKMVLNRQ